MLYVLIESSCKQRTKYKIEAYNIMRTVVRRIPLVCMHLPNNKQATKIRTPFRFFVFFKKKKKRKRFVEREAGSCGPAAGMSAGMAYGAAGLHERHGVRPAEAWVTPLFCAGHRYFILFKCCRYNMGNNVQGGNPLSACVQTGANCLQITRPCLLARVSELISCMLGVSVCLQLASKYFHRRRWLDRAAATYVRDV